MAISFSSPNHIVFSARYMNARARQKTISLLKTVLEITIPFGWNDALFWTHHDLALLFRDDGRFVDARAHIDHARSYTIDNACALCRATEMRASIWYRQHRLGEARSETLRAINIYEKLGLRDLEDCRELSGKSSKRNRMLSMNNLYSAVSPVNSAAPCV